MDQDILIKSLIVLSEAAILVLGGLVARYLKVKTDSDNQARYYDTVKNIVMGIEQVYGSGNGPDKKAEAIQMCKVIVKNKLTTEQINTLIESAVFEINTAMKDASKSNQ